MADDDGMPEVPPRGRFRINYAIERQDAGGDFIEIGFGASSTSSSVNSAVYDVQSQIQNREWETSDDMPDPSEVDHG